MDNSPALVSIADTTRDEGEQTFCEVCHRDAPEGHHGYADTIITESDMSSLLMSNYQNLGHTFGTISYSRIYCSYCHKAHNAGYGGIEPNFIPILVDSGNEICRNCHELGVSHFMGDPTLSSTYEKVEPALYRGQWPGTGLYSEYEGPPESPTIITCNSCHYFLTAGPEASNVNYRLLAPAGEDTEWEPGVPEGYLCTGCHGEAPSTVGGGQTHPLLEADGLKYPVTQSYLDSGETLVSYTENERVNCHSCHRAHRADIQGGVYILKMGRGTNTNPQALQPKVDHETMCISCHSDK
jgi:hypothetical protein